MIISIVYVAFGRQLAQIFTNSYFDWLFSADIAVGKLTLGVAYVDTDISLKESAYLLPNFASTKDGSSIAGSKVVVSVSTAF